MRSVSLAPAPVALTRGNTPTSVSLAAKGLLANAADEDLLALTGLYSIEAIARAFDTDRSSVALRISQADVAAQQIERERLMESGFEAR